MEHRNVYLERHNASPIDAENPSLTFFCDRCSAVCCGCIFLGHRRWIPDEGRRRDEPVGLYALSSDFGGGFFPH